MKTITELEDDIDSIDDHYQQTYVEDLLIVIARILLLCAKKYLGE